MIYKFLDEEIFYDGSQLKSRFAYLTNQILGNSIVAFVGGCDVPFENMVDGEDLLARASIRGKKMLHFIIEEYPGDLNLAVHRQRLFAALALETLKELRPKVEVLRSGDDLYIGGGKLSISIATVSPVSQMIHFAVNITNEGTPVQTSALSDLDLDAKAFADRLAEKFVAETKSIREACCKVAWVT